MVAAEAGSRAASRAAEAGAAAPAGGLPARVRLVLAGTRPVRTRFLLGRQFLSGPSSVSFLAV